VFVFEKIDYCKARYFVAFPSAVRRRTGLEHEQPAPESFDGQRNFRNAVRAAGEAELFRKYAFAEKVENLRVDFAPCVRRGDDRKTRARWLSAFD